MLKTNTYEESHCLFFRNPSVDFRNVTIVRTLVLHFKIIKLTSFYPMKLNYLFYLHLKKKGKGTNKFYSATE